MWEEMNFKYGFLIGSVGPGSALCSEGLVKIIGPPVANHGPSNGTRAARQKFCFLQSYRLRI